MSKLTHLDDSGAAHMVDVSAKAETVREAIAEAGATTRQQMGAVMKIANAKAAGRIDGRALSSEVQKQLGTEANLRLVSISIDPEKDTPEVLKLYAEKFQATDRWLFLTGPKAGIYALARDGFKLPIAEPETPGGQIIHSTRLILIDRLGAIRGFYEATTDAGVNDLIRDIRKLLKEK